MLVTVSALLLAAVQLRSWSPPTSNEARVCLTALADSGFAFDTNSLSTVLDNSSYIALAQTGTYYGLEGITDYFQLTSTADVGGVLVQTQAPNAAGQKISVMGFDAENQTCLMAVYVLFEQTGTTMTSDAEYQVIRSGTHGSSILRPSLTRLRLGCDVCSRR